MNKVVLSDKDKSILFWASFLALAAAGVGFVFRVALPIKWGNEFNITAAEVGSITGAALWPIAITMIIFSLLVDKIGYKNSMFWAFGLQLTSVFLTFFVQGVDSLWWACFFSGLGHGIVEAVINPLCASMYRKEKSKMLNILHASWPAGIVAGGLVFLAIGDDIPWKTIFIFMGIPVLVYGYMFYKCNNYPVDERVEHNVSYTEMLKEFGGLGAFLAITFLFYEVSGHLLGSLAENKIFASLTSGVILGIGIFILITFIFYKTIPRLGKLGASLESNRFFASLIIGTVWGLGTFLVITFLLYDAGNVIAPVFTDSRLLISLLVGAIGGLVFGFQFQSKGKWLFFFLCLVMIPLATAELATDSWIQALMKPIIEAEHGFNALWAIIFSAAIMMILRFFAGFPLKYMSPPALLITSSCFSIVGLYALAGSTGGLILLAFILYAIGQTFYWPTMLGFVSEQFPKGGAMTLNTVSALGLLTVGIFGFPFLGAVKDSFDAKAVKEKQPALYEKYAKGKSFFGIDYNSIKSQDVLKDSSLYSLKTRVDELLSKEEAKVLKAKLSKPSLYKNEMEALKKAIDETDSLYEEERKEFKNNLTNSQEALEIEINESARPTLAVASILPAIMAIAFLAMLIYFRKMGGYRPIVLSSKKVESKKNK